MRSVPYEETFQTTFDGGVSVAVHVNYAALDGPDWIRTTWEGNPGAQVIPPFMAWMHTVLCAVAQQAARKVYYTYEPPARSVPALTFVYHPDGRYEAKKTPPRQ
jgi:hypothetical protein